MGDFTDDGDLRAEEFLAGVYGPGARDQRLLEFGQGGWADAAPGSGWLALQAGDVSRPEVLGEATDDEVLGVGRAWKALEAWSFAGKLAVVRELIRRHPLNEYDPPGLAAGGLPRDWDPRLHHEVAAALGISLVAAGKLAGVAWTLEARLPGIGRALAEGRLDPGRVKMIVELTAVLEREDQFARAEAIILAGLACCRTWSDLERLVQRAVITVDPAGARKRREKAEREDARVRFWREASGACGLAGTGLPTDEALAARAHIEARARDYQAAAIDRPIDILRVMAYLDLLNDVPVAQRAAWARAEDQARAQAEAAERAARAATGAADQGPSDEPGGADGGGPDKDGPDNSGPGNSGPDQGPPDDGGRGDGTGDGPDNDPANNTPTDGSPDSSKPGDTGPEDGGPDPGGPADDGGRGDGTGDGPDNDPANNTPADGSPDTGKPGNSGPRGSGPDDGGPDEDGPADDGDRSGAIGGRPHGGWPADGGAPGDRGGDPAPDGLDDGPLPDDPCAGCKPGQCPGQDWDMSEPPCEDCRDRDCTCGAMLPETVPSPQRGSPGNGSPGNGEPGNGEPNRSRPARGSPEADDRRNSDAGGTVHGKGGLGATPCPQCGGAGGVAGLPVKANLTIPAGALGWLAEWSAEPHDLESGAGGGGPGNDGHGTGGASGSENGTSGNGGHGTSGNGGHGRSAGACPACGTWGGGITALPIREHLAFPLLTLLGLAERPGEAHGLGALDPAVIRDLTAAGARHPGSQFCITVTDDHGYATGHGCGRPLRGNAAKAARAARAASANPSLVPPGRVTFTPSGTSWVLTLPGAPLPLLVDIEAVPVYECDHRHASAGYRPGDRLRHLVQVRDGKCSYPACSRHARDCDFEHAIPYQAGGATCACNAHASSRACHRVKQSEGWQVTKPRPGWTQWTTMAGRTYLQGPWRYPS